MVKHLLENPTQCINFNGLEILYLAYNTKELLTKETLHSSITTSYYC